MPPYPWPFLLAGLAMMQSANDERLLDYSFHQRIVIRVPRVTPVEPVRWRETRAERCVPLENLAGAAFNAARSVDLVLSGGQRLRAHFKEECPAIDFYSGFYIRPTSDGLVCARRDAVRSRSGASCEIHAFRRLVPRR